jgi:hypothetical protein
MPFCDASAIVSDGGRVWSRVIRYSIVRAALTDGQKEADRVIWTPTTPTESLNWLEWCSSLT